MESVASTEHKDINLAEFLSVCIYLSEQCGKVIREVAKSGDLQIKSKGLDNPVTVADIKVQKTIEDNLRHLYPTLNIQGEESKESMEGIEPAVVPGSMPEALKSFVSSAHLASKYEERRAFIEEQLRTTYTVEEIAEKNFETFNTSNAVVWIDPLDGTSDFVKGNLPAVTVLIGLAVDGYSRAGVIHNPFSVEDQEKSVTFFGTGEHGAFKTPFTMDMGEKECSERAIEYLEPFKHDQEPAEDHVVKVAASLSHFNERMQEIIKTIEPVEICRMGGAGNKCNNLAIGNVDSYIHPSPGLCYWDLCATESLIKGMGGYSTNLLQERLRYPLDGDRKIKGLILARNPPMYRMIGRRMGDVLKNILQTVKL